MERILGDISKCPDVVFTRTRRRTTGTDVRQQHLGCKTMISTGIVGASGYTGVELMRLLSGHPIFNLEVIQAHSHAGDSVGSVYPSLALIYPGLHYEPIELDKLSSLDCLFLALPHGQSQELVSELVSLDTWHGVIVDLSADFRLKEPSDYEVWYAKAHIASYLLDRFVYGLPELYRASLKVAKLIAAPGCYPTASILALYPFIEEGILDKKSIIVDAASGISGAGSGANDTTHFARADEDFTAYGSPTHRHTPEIDQVLEATITFTPHLAPMSRGILATCYADMVQDMDSESAIQLLRDFYMGSPFVSIVDGFPHTKSVLGSNSAHLSARVDSRTGRLVSMCAIDNLVKGASGQAIQCANIAFGIAEDKGLPKAGIFP